RTSSAAMGRRRLPSATNGVPQPRSLADSVSDTIHPTHRTARTSRPPVMIQRTLLPRAGAAGSFDMMSLRGRKKPKSQGTEPFSVRVIAPVNVHSVEPEAEANEVKRTAERLVESVPHARVGELRQRPFLQVRHGRRPLEPLDGI